MGLTLQGTETQQQGEPHSPPEKERNHSHAGDQKQSLGHPLNLLDLHLLLGAETWAQQDHIQTMVRT